MSVVLRLVCALGLFVGVGAGVSACNTIEGVGEDISSGARTVKRTINGN